MPLDVNVTRISQLFSTTLGGTGQHKWVAVGYLPSSRSIKDWKYSIKLGSDEPVSPCQKGSSGVFENGSFSLSPAGSMRGFIFYIYCENQFEFLEINLTIIWSSPPTPCDCIPLKFLTLKLVCTKHLTIPQLCSGFLRLALVPWKVSTGKSLFCKPQLLEFVCLSNLGNSNLSCVLPSLMDPRSVDFSACLLFYLLGWLSPTSLTCGTKSWKSWCLFRILQLSKLQCNRLHTGFPSHLRNLSGNCLKDTWQYFFLV